MMPIGGCRGLAAFATCSLVMPMPLVFFLSHEVKTMMMTFHAGKLWLTLSNLAAARISYSRGKASGQGKVGDLTTDVGTLDRQRAGLDCSGYIQYVVYQGSSHNVWIPQGTSKQQEWLDEKKYRKMVKKLVRE